MITRSRASKMPKDSRDATWRRFPARAIYLTYPQSINGFTGPARFSGKVNETEVDVTYVTRHQYVIRALTDMTVANPTRELKAGKTARVSKMSIIFKEPTT